MLLVDVTMLVSTLLSHCVSKHLGIKADMSVNSAVFQDIRGELVKASKRTSLWITLGMLLALIVFLAR